MLKGEYAAAIRKVRVALKQKFSNLLNCGRGGVKKAGGVEDFRLGAIAAVEI